MPSEKARCSADTNLPIRCSDSNTWFRFSADFGRAAKLVQVPPTEGSSHCCSHIQQRGGRPIR
jgi:hypothetical protein